MKIDYKKIERITGRRFETADEFFLYIERTLDFLLEHNKNYTQTQYHKILELNEFFDALEF